MFGHRWNSSALPKIVAHERDAGILRRRPEFDLDVAAGVITESGYGNRPGKSSLSARD
jgi:hypothetical protein